MDLYDHLRNYVCNKLLKKKQNKSKEKKTELKKINMCEDRRLSKIK